MGECEHVFLPVHHPAFDFLTLIVKGLNQIDVYYSVGIAGIDCFMRTAERTLNGLRRAQNIQRSHSRVYTAAYIAELVLGLKTPRGGVVKRGAARNVSYLLLYLLNGITKNLFAITKVASQRKIIIHVSLLPFADRPQTI